MSIGGSMGGSRSQTQQQSQTDPWAPTQPLLRDVISRLQGVSSQPGDGSTEAAIDRLSSFYGDGGGSADVFRRVGHDLVDTPDRTGQIDTARTDLTQRLSATADGQNLNLSENPHLQSMLQQVGDDAQKRINAQFAGAGRDLSGANNLEVGRGVTQAQLPILFDQFNREQGRTDAAARDLANFGLEGARTQTGMDTARGALRRTGAETIQASRELEAGDLGQQLDLAMARERLPYDRIGWLTELLNPVAGLGSQSQGTSSTRGSQWGVGARGGLTDLGRILATLG